MNRHMPLDAAIHMFMHTFILDIPVQCSVMTPHYLCYRNESNIKLYWSIEENREAENLQTVQLMNYKENGFGTSSTLL